MIMQLNVILDKDSDLPVSYFLLMKNCKAVYDGLPQEKQAQCSIGVVQIKIEDLQEMLDKLEVPYEPGSTGIQFGDL